MGRLYRRYNTTCGANDDALMAMCKTVPTTLAGLAALADYAAEIFDDELEMSAEQPRFR
jgi:hypothetical protein